MSQQDLLKKVIHTLEKMRIQYMVTGSVASSLQGEPRSTHDIDVVISLHKSQVSGLIRSFPQTDYYLDEDTVSEAIANKSMFNLIDINEGDKVDFWILKDDEFDRTRFARRYNENIMGMELKVSSPEDTILAKLHWAKLSGGSEKQFTDALRVYEVQFDKLDMRYIEHWAKLLSIESLWRRLTDEAEIELNK